LAARPGDRAVTPPPDPDDLRAAPGGLGHGASLRRWLPWLWLLALALAIAAFHGVRSDDSFITFRYGQNLALGRGPVFNVGQRDLASTSPAQLLLSGLVYTLAGREFTPGVMAALGCLGWMTQGAALFWLLAGPFGEPVALLVAVASALGLAAPMAYVPLETNQAAALGLLTLVAAQRDRFKAAAALGAGAGLFRPDAYLLVALVGGLCLYRLRRRALQPAAVFLAITAPWFAFATYYYGRPLPISLDAKLQRETVRDYLVHEVVLGGRTWLPVGGAPDWLVALGAWPLAVAGAIMLIRKGGAPALLPIHGFLHLAAYLYLRPPRPHGWHLYPALAALAACLCLAIATAAVAAQGKVRWPARFALVLVLALAAQRTAHTALDHPRSYWIGGRHHAYLGVADFLRRHGDPGREEFAAVEVGTIAYYSDFPAFDMARLVTRSPAPGQGRTVRWVVVDGGLLRLAPPVPAVFRSERGGFEAFVFDLYRELPPVAARP
jgi:hypothetical protein